MPFTVRRQNVFSATVPLASNWLNFVVIRQNNLIVIRQRSQKVFRYRYFWKELRVIRHK